MVADELLAGVEVRIVLFLVAEIQTHVNQPCETTPHNVTLEDQ
jgi:hypothetical protein